MASFDEFYESLPEDSNKRGEYFEKVFIPWFLKTDPEWSSQVQKVWLWDDYPHRWGKDCGIDLVYEDKQGKHWAVQSKCISPDREISKAEIDSFLSESSDSRIYGRLLIASTDGIGKNAQQVIDRQEKQVVCFLLEHFRHSEVDFPSSTEDLSTGRRKEKRTPRPHQKEAVRNVVQGLQIADRGQLLMACGTGKTLTSLWIKEALQPKRTLVLLPSLSLLSQTLREWSATSKEEFNWICVCSDKSVAKQDKSTDSIIEHVSGLGVPVTSNPKDIQDFLENEEGGVVFSTYQSSELVADSQKNPSIPGFDITFADEAHRCTGKISSAFACVLDGERIRSNKRLFMTATPRVLSRQIKKRADEENISLACMDDVSQFGEVFHQLNFSEAIDRELLSDYQVVIIGVDDPSVEAKINNRSIVQTANDLEVDTETLANHIALAKAIKDYDLSRLITFHGRVRSAKKFSEDHHLILDWLQEDSKSSKTAITSYVSGEMSARDRNTEINKLRNISEKEVGILANARCLSEGVDVPTLDGIAFFDPRSSQVDIIQAIGRAIRKSENKTDGYIILPVYLGDLSNIEDEILQSRFKDIWNIILALKSQDNSIRDTLDQLRIEYGKRKIQTRTGEGITKIRFDLPSRIPAGFADSITTILIQETTENWMEKYGQLLQYIEDNGTPNVPQNNPMLGKWVHNQRTKKKNGILSTERIGLLEKVNFSWDPKIQKWNQNYQLLVKYKSEHGDLNIPSEHKELRTWVSNVRRSKKNNVLSEDQIKLLDKVGFAWDQLEQNWQDNYQQLKAFINKGGEETELHENPKLANWASNQRVNKRAGRLKEDQIKLLEEVGFIWDPLEQEWHEKYQKFKIYVAQCGDAKIPFNHPELGSWVDQQRQARKKNKISETRIKLLNESGFIWDQLEHEWQEKYEQFKKLVEETGDPNIPTSNQTLWRWSDKQRNANKKGALSDARKMLLDELGFIWDPREREWQQKYQLLMEYVKENGSTNIPLSYPVLGNWVRVQRRNKNGNRLTEERKRLLDELGFIWDAR